MLAPDMDVIQMIFLALVQGVTEFLPVSSSAHLILPAYFTDWPDQGLAFDVAVHLGSLLAVMAYFRSTLTELTVSAWAGVTQRQFDANCQLILKVAVATLPTIIAGVLLKDLVATELRSIGVIATTTIVFGALLWISDRRTTYAVTNERDIGWPIAIAIGLAQAIALIPGTSRSGITMTAAMLMAVAPTAAARFSFLLSLPTIAGAALLTGLDVADAGLDARWMELFWGLVLSAGAAYITIGFFLRLLERTGMTPYVIYRLALGAVLASLALGWL